MSQSGAEAVVRSNRDWSSWRLPSQSQEHEPERNDDLTGKAKTDPDRAESQLGDTGDSQGGESSGNGTRGSSSGNPENSQQQPAPQTEAESPSGWNTEDYKLYLSLTESLRRPSEGAASASDRIPAPSVGVDPGTPSGTNDSHNFANSAMDVLWRVWDRLSGESASRLDLQNLASDRSLVDADRKTIQRLVQDDAAFSYIDRLDLNQDGRISRFAISNYATTAGGSIRPGSGNTAAYASPDVPIIGAEPPSAGQQAAEDKSGTSSAFGSASNLRATVPDVAEQAPPDTTPLTTPADPPEALPASTAMNGTAIGAPPQPLNGAGQGLPPEDTLTQSASSATPAAQPGEAATSQPDQPAGAVQQPKLDTVETRSTPSTTDGETPTSGQASDTETAVPQAPGSDAMISTDARLESSLVDNFAVLDQALGASDGLVSLEDIKAASISGVLTKATRDDLILVSDPATFSRFDAFDGNTDGNISWSAVRASASDEHASVAPNASVMSARYSDEFYSIVHTSLNSPELFSADSSDGTFDAESLSRSASEKLKMLANDTVMFRQFDALDGKIDGNVRLADIKSIAEPSQLLLAVPTKDDNGQPTTALRLAYQRLSAMYSGVKQPEVPGDVNNDGQRAFNMALALYDNLGKVLPTAADGSRGTSVSAEDLRRAVADTANLITSEDRSLLSQLADDSAVLSWISSYGTDEGGSGAIGVSDISKLVSDWNKAHYNAITFASSAKTRGLEGLKAEDGAWDGFKEGMTQGFVSEEFLNPAKVEVFYNRLMSDAGIQADLRTKLREILPDANNIALDIRDRISSAEFKGYLDWAKRTGVFDATQSQQVIAGEIGALNTLDPTLAAEAGDALIRQEAMAALLAKGKTADQQTAEMVMGELLRSMTNIPDEDRMAYSLDAVSADPNRWSDLVGLLYTRLTNPQDPSLANADVALMPIAEALAVRGVMNGKFPTGVDPVIAKQALSANLLQYMEESKAASAQNGDLRFMLEELSKSPEEWSRAMSILQKLVSNPDDQSVLAGNGLAEKAATALMSSPEFQQVRKLIAERGLSVETTYLSDVTVNVLRALRSAGRMSGNILSMVLELEKVPAEFNLLVKRLVGTVNAPGFQVDMEASKLELPKKVTSLASEINKSGILGTLAGVFGLALGGVLVTKYAQDDKSTTSQERLQEGLAFVTALSYGGQATKTISYISKNFASSDFLSKFSSLSGHPLVTLLSSDGQGFAQAVKVVESSTEGRVRTNIITAQNLLSDAVDTHEYLRDFTNRKTSEPKFTTGSLLSAAAFKAAIGALDIAGGVMSTVLGFQSLNEGKRMDDVGTQVAGGFMVAGGLSWGVGGGLSLASSVLSAPFFVVSGALALAGILANIAGSDPGKHFAESLSKEYLPGMEDYGLMRTGWRDSVSGWWHENWFNQSEDDSGMGMDM